AESNEPISNSQGSMVLGTPQYLSPEQAMGRPVDGRSDVYSLGIVAFHALTGRPPFEAPNPIAMAMAHVNKTPPKICELVPELPSVTNGVFGRVLAKRPSARYQSPRLFARDLHDIASGRWYLVKLSNRLGLAGGFDKADTRPEPVAQVPEPVGPAPAPASSPHTVPYTPGDLERTVLDLHGSDDEQ
ncbi:MAG: hypothetical protein KDK70_40990, partial [Myxococcales bacterium]|nr:hypothetical protein [Myxococcales bacterium]